ncbi:MAG: hypothetical protein M3Y36_10485, partial [Actinomycetota bacterium]|nr:hypothetical protein [Actinomycetota bacterium]
MSGQHSRLRRWLGPSVVIVAGVALSVVLAVSFSLRTHDAIVLFTWSAGGAAVTGILAALLLAWVRRTRTGTQT